MYHSFETGCEETERYLPLLGMDTNPALWLHLAECCVSATKRSFSHDVKHLYPKSGTISSSGNADALEPILSSIGTGLHRKLVLNMSPSHQTLPSDSSSSQLTMDFASQCLKNALKFCEHPELDSRQTTAPTSSSPRGNGNSSSANSSAQASPVKSISSIDKSLLLRASILAK